MIGLVPTAVAVRDDVNISDAIELDRDDLPSPIHAYEELIRWKRRWSACDEESRLESIARALKICDPDMYPNLNVLMRMAATLPVILCECERSGIVLKRLNTYLGASMGQERRSGLAFIHINYDADINEEEVIDIFASKKKRALEFRNICS